MASDPAGLLSQLLGTTGQGYNGMQQVQQDRQQSMGNQQTLALGQAKLNALQQAAAQEKSYQDDVASYFADPRPERLSQLSLRYPEQAQAFQNTYKMMGDAQKQSAVTQFGGIYNAAKNGRSDLVSKLIGNVITAEKAQGIDTAEAEDLKAQLDGGDPKALTTALAFSQMHLSAADPSVAKALGIGAESDEFSNTPQGDIYSKKTGVVSHAGQPKSVVKTVRNGDGTTSIVQVNPDGSQSPVSPEAGQIDGSQIEQLALASVPGATVTSRQRTPQHNAEVGGVPNSRHITGDARDLVPPAGMPMAAFAATLKRAVPGVKVINEGDHVHLEPTAPAKFNATGTKVLYTSKGGGAKGAGVQSDVGTLDQGTLSMMADQYLAGDKSVFQNLGRGQQGSGNVVRLRKMVAERARANGMNGAGIAAQMADFAGTMAAERASGTRIANVEMASTEAEKLIPLALSASDALPRSSFVPFAKAQQMVQSGTNNPALRKFVTANNALVNVYSRAISPTGAPTVADKEHARELLNTAYDSKSYKAVVEQMRQEIQQARAAPRAVRADIRSQVSSGGRPGMPSDIQAILKKYGH